MRANQLQHGGLCANHRMCKSKAPRAPQYRWRSQKYATSTWRATIKQRNASCASMLIISQGIVQASPTHASTHVLKPSYCTALRRRARAAPHTQTPAPRRIVTLQCETHTNKPERPQVKHCDMQHRPRTSVRRPFSRCDAHRHMSYLCSISAIAAPHAASAASAAATASAASAAKRAFFSFTCLPLRLHT
jgi:hypothetical protein